MTKISPDVYSANAGDVIRITVQSVNFVMNVNLDPQLTQVGAGSFSKAGELSMGSSDATFGINYNFPTPLPAGGKYTRTITGPGGFTDGPFDVVQIGSEMSLTLPYIVKVAASPMGGD